MPPQCSSPDDDHDPLSTTTTNMTSGSIPSSAIIIIVNPYSTGCLVAQEIYRRGYRLLCLWTRGFAEDMKTHIPLACSRHHHYYTYELTEQDSLEDTKRMVLLAATTNGGATIGGCIAGGEAGVDLADALSQALGLDTTNATPMIPNRRDKQVQQELMAAAGMRSIRQAAGTELSHVQVFLQTEPYPIVVKPTESAGSDGVKLCHNYEEASEHFEVLMKRQMVNGGACPAVLCQEFLRGPEYVIDHVSRDGQHKTCMVWKYDKRPANGATFVYFGMLPVAVHDHDDENHNNNICDELISYVRQVLDVLVFRHGASHAEVIWTATGPCLVEMNCRAHGGDGSFRPLCRALTGGRPSQVEAAVDALLDPAAFDRLPDRPPSPFRAAGQEVILVSYSKGTVVATPGYDVIRCLPSFLTLETGIQVGSAVDYTTDLVTAVGSVILVHDDANVLARDVQFIRTLEEINGLFTYETRLEALKRSDSYPHHQRYPFSADGPHLVRHMSNDRPELCPLTKRMTTVDASQEAVVLVDPYSTGCLIAEEIAKRGYQLICVWTSGFSPEMKTHVPLSCGDALRYKAEVTQAPGNDVHDTMQLVLDAAGPLRVVACLAGGEAGVDLADQLSECLGVRSNGTRIPNRRDKKVQQELIAAAGLRSVRQAAGTDISQVQDFLRTEAYPVVLKPTESAGSDGVKLCHNFHEAQQHFDVLMKSQMVNGGDCPAVLCQEFLRGKEYVVDHVSRNGVHKTTMVWVYDKRETNGAAFVYFGMIPVPLDSPEAQILIPYVRDVLDALDLKNGPSHGEVMMTPDGPCLVEMNCRAHGGDGNWRPLCRALTGGHSQVESAVDAYLDHKAFACLPDRPPSPFRASGQEVILVSYSRGTVLATPGFDVIRQLRSFVYLETGVKPGTAVEPTIDLFTGIGSVILVHEDAATLKADVDMIRQLEVSNELFTYAPVMEDLRSHHADDGKRAHQRIYSAGRIDQFI